MSDDAWSHFYGLTNTFTEEVAARVLSCTLNQTIARRRMELEDAGATRAAAKSLLNKVLCSFCFETRFAHASYLKEHLCFCDHTPRELKMEVASKIYKLKALRSNDARRRILEEYAHEYLSQGLT
jgi:hypothetical protein